MSKEVDLEKPLSDDDREYLKQRSRYYDIEENDRQNKKGKFADDYEEEFSPNYTVAAPPIEPGSDADRPPEFVGQRPYGVDRGVWGGSTGKTEGEALEGESGEPHSDQSIIGPAPDDDPKWQEPALANPESTAAASDKAKKPAKVDPLDEQETMIIDELNVEDLKAELEARDLPVSGNKAELQKRLKDAVEKE